MSYENKYEMREGRILLYTRNGKPTYHARIRIDGVPGYVVKTTKRHALTEAMLVAEELYDDLRYKARHGLEIKAHDFGQAWHRWRATNALLLSLHRLKFFDGTAVRYFLPFFGEKSIESINDQTLQDYWEWRIKYWSSEAGLEKIQQAKRSRTTPTKKYKQKLGNVAPVPAAKTLQMEQSALRQVFQWAYRVGIISRVPAIKAPQPHHSRSVVRRPAFDHAEWTQLKLLMEEWALRFGRFEADRANSSHQYQRHLLRAYVLFMINSGFRPNEARQIRWRDITYIRDAKGKEQIVLHVSPSTKTGERDVVPLKKIQLALEIIRQISKHTGPDDLVICDRQGRPIDNFGKTFKKLLILAGLLKDRHGRLRSIYSLRHTYATFMLLQGANVEDLAQNMGTSPFQIFKHYRHVTMHQKANEMGLIGSHW